MGTLNFFSQTSGTWINITTVLIGTMLGLGLRDRLPARIQQIIPQGVGLTVIFIGITMANTLPNLKAGQVNGVILGLLCLVLGGVLGEWWQIEEQLTAIGNWLKRRFQGKGSFTEGYVTASVLFCVGPMTLIGSLNNGLTGDPTLLTLKATMDGLAAIALSASLGVGVGFSSLTILVYQGGLSLVAGHWAQALPDPNSPGVLIMTGVGGLMILATGFNLLQVAQVRVASFIPALAIAPLVYRLIETL